MKTRNIPFFHIDAFASEIFAGNPAGVCFLLEWPSEELLQKVAAENNLSETAFLVPPRQGSCFELRWFSPVMEIDLCGHATLAAAHAIFEQVDQNATLAEFLTRSGPLSVVREDDLLVMDFPARPPDPCEMPAGLAGILGLQPLETHCARDLLVVLEDEDQVRELQPDLAGIGGLDQFAVIVTAPGNDCDFVSRFFAPRAGIPEDPVTGSAHCTLIPFWSGRLGKPELHARQLSARGGELFCADRGERVSIGGRAVMYSSGNISITEESDR